MSAYDVAVLGGGPGGYTAALRAAVRGAKVCLVEAGALGGTCLNVGCIPTKAMLHASGLAWDARNAGRLGLTGGAPAVDPAALAGHVTRTVDILRKGIEGHLKARKVDVIAGRGRLTAPDTIEVTCHGRPGRAVDQPTGETPVSRPSQPCVRPTHGRDARVTRTVTAKAVIIATGSRPARPGFAPWGSPAVFTTDEASRADALPESILIVGGGVIGCEFATVYSELGVETHLVEALGRLLPDVDADASKILTRNLTKRKVKVATGAGVASMAVDDAGVTAELTDGKNVRAAAALIAVGRTPNVEDIGLESLGVELEGGVIRVDDRCCTNVEGVYAVGDVAETMQYAHLAARMGVIAADNAAGHQAADDRSVVPECIYTHPEIAAVGMRQDLAAARAATFPLQASGLARAYGQTDGFVRLYAGDDGAVLAGLAVGPHATDVINEVALAVRNGLTLDDVAETIHAHPTIAESFVAAAESLLGLAIHTLE